MSRKKLIDADIVMENLMNATIEYGQPSMLHKVIRDTINDLPYLYTDESVNMDGGYVVPVSKRTSLRSNQDSENEGNEGEMNKSSKAFAVWIDNADSYICSNCGQENGYKAENCPYCGAAMLSRTEIEYRSKVTSLLQLLQDTCKDVRERHVDDSVCGLCEYDAPLNEAGDGMIGGDCPGFDRNDCFKLKQDIIDEYCSDAKINF